MIGFYNYTVILTYVSLLISFFGITFAFDGDISHALLCLMISGFCDMFDGKIASTKKDRTKSEKAFGIQIDSLCDIVCFGVLPAVILYETDPGSLFITVLAGLFVLCGLIRLAFFNVDEAERQQETDESRKYYLGLPITASASILPLFWWINEKVGTELNIIIPAAMLVTGLCYILPFKLKKPHLAGKLSLSLVGVGELILLILNGL